MLALRAKPQPDAHASGSDRSERAMTSWRKPVEARPEEIIAHGTIADITGRLEA